MKRFITQALFLLAMAVAVTGCNSTPEINNEEDEQLFADFPWLKEIVDNFNTMGYNRHARISQCEYKDGIGFLLEMCVGCPDFGYSFRNHEGILLCGGGGLSGEDNCQDFYIDYVNKKIIWEMKNKN